MVSLNYELIIYPFILTDLPLSLVVLNGAFRHLLLLLLDPADLLGRLATPAAPPPGLRVGGAGGEGAKAAAGVGKGGTLFRMVLMQDRQNEPKASFLKEPTSVSRCPQTGTGGLVLNSLDVQKILKILSTMQIKASKNCS